MKYLLIPLSLLLFVACSEKPSSQEDIVQNTEQDLEAIKTQVTRFSALVMEGDFDGVGEMYSSEASIFPTNSDIIKGREEITAYWNAPGGGDISYHKVTPIEIKVWEDEAYDYGYYEGKSLDSLGTEIPWKGKYVIVWKKENDEWKIYLDIWNRIVE